MSKFERCANPSACNHGAHRAAGNGNLKSRDTHPRGVKSIRMGKTLVIVESPAKARTISRYLGSDYYVAASVGHVRDLPKKELGVDIEAGFEPKYVTIRGKGKILKDLKRLEAEIQKDAYAMQMLMKVRETINSLTTGVAMLIDDDQQEFEEARGRITSMLINIIGMMDANQDVLARMYIRSMFSNVAFQRQLVVIGEKVGVGPVIERAREIFEERQQS